MIGKLKQMFGLSKTAQQPEPAAEDHISAAYGRAYQRNERATEGVRQALADLLERNDSLRIGAPKQ
jgi:hypothetical protein